jgi:hypothetical protein
LSSGVDGDPRGDDLIDAVEHVGRQFDPGRREVGLQLLRRPRADDRRCDARVAKDKSDRQLVIKVRLHPDW